MPYAPCHVDEMVCRKYGCSASGVIPVLLGPGPDNLSPCVVRKPTLSTRYTILVCHRRITGRIWRGGNAFANDDSGFGKSPIYAELKGTGGWCVPGLGACASERARRAGEETRWNCGVRGHCKMWHEK